MSDTMTPEAAIASVRASFPFAGYMDYVDPVGQSYLDLAATVQRYLAPGSAVLDFGAGPADKTAVIRALGYACAACDDLQDEWYHGDGIHATILDYARAAGIDYRLAVAGEPLPFPAGAFDMVMMHHVLEHLHHSPRDLLNDLLELVRPGGYLFVTVPNAVNIRKRLDVLLGRTNHTRFEYYYWFPGPWRGHVREYTRGDLDKLARYLGLELLELRGCHQMLKRLPPAARGLYLGLTGIFPDWRDTWLMVARKPAGWAPRRALAEADYAAVLGAATANQFRASLQGFRAQPARRG